MDLTTDPTQHLLTKWLDAAATRQRVIVDNMANSDTPGFIRKDVSFDAQLAQVQGGNATTIAEDRSNAPRIDGNNVVIDQELAELNKNALLQQMAVQLLQTKMSMTKIAATGKS